MLKRISDLGFSIELNKASKEFLGEKGFDKDFGARPLARALQKYLEDPLAEEILKSNLSEGDLIKVSHKKGTEELILKVVPAKKEAKEAKEKKE